MPTNHSTLSIAALSAPSLPMAALMMPLVIFIPAFFAEQMGMGMAAVGAIFALGRLFDGVTDPIAGGIMDKTQARFSKRAWLATGAVPLAVATFQIFINPPSTTGALMAWVLVLYTGWTMMSLGLYAWGAEVSDDYHQRSRIAGAIQMANSIGSIGVLLVPASFELLGVEGDLGRLRVQAMGVFILCMLPVGVALAWFLAPRKTWHSRVAPAAILPALKTALHSRATRRVLTADLLVGINIGLFTSLSVFFTEIVLGLGGSAAILQLALLGTGLLGVPFFVALARKLEKHKAMALTTLFTGGGGLALFLLPPGEFGLTLAVYLFYGIGSAACQLLPRAIMADVVDEHMAASGENNTGLYFSFLTTTLKMGLALGVALSFGLAGLAGFDPATARTDESAHWVVRSLMGFGPLLLGVVITLVVWRFPLDRKRQEALREQIARGG